MATGGNTTENRGRGDSKGSKPDKIIRDALILELNRMDTHDGEKVKKVNRIVHKLVNCAIEGKIDAIREIFDRVEGRPSQDVAIAHTGELTLKSVVVSQLVSFFESAAGRLEDRSDENVVPN